MSWKGWSGGVRPSSQPHWAAPPAKRPKVGLPRPVFVPKGWNQAHEAADEVPDSDNAVSSVLPEAFRHPGRAMAMPNARSAAPGSLATQQQWTPGEMNWTKPPTAAVSPGPPPMRPRPAPPQPTQEATQVEFQLPPSLTPDKVEQGMVVYFDDSPNNRGWVDNCFNDIDEFWVRQESTKELVMQAPGSSEMRSFHASELRWIEGEWSREVIVSDTVEVPDNVALRQFLVRQAGDYWIQQLHAATQVLLCVTETEKGLAVVVGPGFCPDVKAAIKVVEQELARLAVSKEALLGGAQADPNLWPQYLPKPSWVAQDGTDKYFAPELGVYELMPSETFMAQPVEPAGSTSAGGMPAANKAPAKPEEDEADEYRKGFEAFMKMSFTEAEKEAAEQLEAQKTAEGEANRDEKAVKEEQDSAAASASVPEKSADKEKEHANTASAAPQAAPESPVKLKAPEQTKPLEEWTVEDWLHHQSEAWFQELPLKHAKKKRTKTKKPNAENGEDKPKAEEGEDTENEPKEPKRKPASPESVLERLKACKVVPVIKLDDEAHGAPLAKALLEGGIDVAEITFRTACAEAAIRETTKNVEGVCVGAGTVLNASQVNKAIQAGADFIVSPGFDFRVCRRCKQRGVLYLPGVVTPTEVMKASQDHNLKTLKFFPASNYGGAGTLKSFSAVFQGISFMPTGGVTEANIKDFVSLPNVIAAGGSWMVSDAAVKAAADSGDWSSIVEGAKKAAAAAR